MIDDLPASSTSNCRKYQSENPLVRWRLERFLDQVVKTVGELAPASMVDLGCGEGIVARLLHQRLPEADYLGVDPNREALACARSLNPELHFRLGSLLESPAPEQRAELALCLEVVEHLPDQDRTVKALLAWTEGYALISVPWEPFFRLGNLLRGRHLATWGDHPEHVQHFGRRSFRRLLERHATILRLWSSFPWLLALVGR